MQRLRAAALSDPGRKRTNNEDCYHADPERGIFLVVDGVGGQAAGEKAAQTAVELIRARLERSVGSAAERIREGITLANNEIFSLAQQNPAWHGMACVLTLAIVDQGQVTIGHVGDSRLYYLEPGHIQKLTRDHSPVGEREDRGELSEMEAMRHPRRNEVYRDVGSEPHTPQDAGFVDITEHALPPQAALLLCSDGLSDLVPQEQTRQLIELNADDLNRAASALIAAANEAGGKDNITVILVAGPEYAQTIHAGNGQPSEKPVAPPRRPWLPVSLALLVGLGLGWLASQWIRRPPVVPEPPHQAATLHVGGAGQTPYSSIRMALAKAVAGDTVLVAPGQYHEALHVPTGVKLISESPQQAVLKGSDAPTVVSIEGANGSSVQGFLISPQGTGSSSVGLVVHDADTLLLNLEITGATEAAVVVSGGSHAVLSASRLHDNPGAGVLIRDSAVPELWHNVIASNGKGSTPRPGVEIRDLAKPVLAGNLLLNNQGGAVWRTPLVDEASLINRNYFSIGGKPTRSPIRLMGR